MSLPFKGLALGLLAALALAACQQAVSPVGVAASSSPQVQEGAGGQADDLRSFALAALPPDPSFPHADDEAAARWGQRAFYDGRLSADHHASCGGCHQPERAFTDGLPRARAIADGPRNTPTLIDAAYHHWQGWGGRGDSLWDQALAALENPLEMGADHVSVARYVAEHERAAYEGLYGPFPDMAAWPAKGGPGNQSYDALPPAVRADIETVAARQGQALASYLRRLVAPPAPIDRYVAGDASAISPGQARGFTLFRGKARCVQCHSGPLFTDDQFHNLGTPLPVSPPYDTGRAQDLAKLLLDPFSAAGGHGVGSGAVPDASPADEGAFHTPSLRNVAVTGPYMHLGNFVSLAAVVDFDLAGGGTGSHHFFVGTVDAKLEAVKLTSAEHDDLLAFLETLTSPAVPAPWGQPPRP